MWFQSHVMHNMQQGRSSSRMESMLTLRRQGWGIVTWRSDAPQEFYRRLTFWNMGHPNRFDLRAQKQSVGNQDQCHHSASRRTNPGTSFGNLIVHKARVKCWVQFRSREKESSLRSTGLMRHLQDHWVRIVLSICPVGLIFFPISTAAPLFRLSHFFLVVHFIVTQWKPLSKHLRPPNK